jgi:ribosomal protein S18 acetylase RimI-like enzyme
MPNSPASKIDITRADAAALDRAAWELVAQSWPEEERGGQLAATADAIAAGRGDSLLVLEARTAGNLVGVAFAQLLAGRAAVVTTPQTVATNDALRCSLEDQLFARQDAELRAAGTRLTQCLLPFHDPAAECLRRTGFNHTADLLYLVATSESFPDQPPQPPFELVPADPVAESTRFSPLLERTYVGSLDCPQVDGLRSTSEVLSGYRATGEFRSGLWQIVRAAGRDVGCLILAFHPAGKHCELIYLGLAPEVRGRGWGLELTRAALALTAAAGGERLVLAVDAANEPAVRMYVASGFSAWDRRQLWIKPLGIPK